MVESRGEASEFFWSPQSSLEAMTGSPVGILLVSLPLGSCRLPQA